MKEECSQNSLLPTHCFGIPKMKDCRSDPTSRYYYDTETKKCQPYVYTGCDDGTNVFRLLETCLRSCHSYVELAQKYEQATTLPDFCTLPKKTGRCKASFPRYYYNTGTQKCEAFVYGGCEKNANNFLILQDCVDQCQRFGGGDAQLR
ncbi:BPTI/Kunitz domain-containing protein-like [Paroedura picta]|uniref:BPTI/Kunitz domain-containing protein-like n=1 Tax=Paroedura picta TaxID=143630 RepID=UPI004055A389